MAACPDIAPATAPALRYSPSGFEILQDPGYASPGTTTRAHCTEVIVHPRFPRGAIHFLHPSRMLRAERTVSVPGLPFALLVDQRQVGRERADPSDDDDTGHAVWRGATVLARHVLLAENHVGQAFRPQGGRRRCVELGCGSAAVASTVAAYVGFDAYATDGVASCVEDAKRAVVANLSHRVSITKNGPRAAAPRGRVVAVERLAWSQRDAERFVARRGRVDLVLGSEVVYALRQEKMAQVHARFADLAATIATLLEPTGVAVLAWCRRSEAERLFFELLPAFGLRAQTRTLTHLGLSREQTEGIVLVEVTPTRTGA